MKRLKLVMMGVVILIDMVNGRVANPAIQAMVPESTAVTESPPAKVVEDSYKAHFIKEGMLF